MSPAMDTRQPIFHCDIQGPAPAPGLHCRVVGTWLHGALVLDGAPDRPAVARWLRALSVTVVSEADALPRIAPLAPEVVLDDTPDDAVVLPSGAAGRAIVLALDLRDIWPKLPDGAVWAHLSARDWCSVPVRIAPLAERLPLDADAEPLFLAYDAARAERWAEAADAFAAAFAESPELRARLDRPHTANAAHVAARADQLGRASTWLEEHIKICSASLAAIQREADSDPGPARAELLAQRKSAVLARMGLRAGA